MKYGVAVTIVQTGYIEVEADCEEEAKAKAEENLVMTTLPKLPESGDLTDTNAALVDTKAMGGINGYAVSAYTKAPNACLAFVEFATGYEMVVKRSEMLEFLRQEKTQPLQWAETQKCYMQTWKEEM